MPVLLAAPAPFEPEPCVTHGQAPARSSAVPATVLVIIIVAAWTVLVAVGVPASAATTGLGAAAGLGLHIAARLAKRAEGGRRA